jgi:hypothetical protein
MFSDFLPSRKFNPYRGLGNSCPVCGSSSGKCKEQAYELSSRNGKTVSTTKTFCMTGTGGNGHPDYHYFNDTRDGQWGIYIPLADWNEHRGESRQATPLEREEWVKEQERKKQVALDAENQKRAESLPIAERDIAARAILNQLSLNDIDRSDLIRRGFTNQQIKEIGFKSVDPYQRLREPVNPRFPGVTVQGDRLNNWSMGGILIPIYTITGEIVAFQIRNRAPGKNRYRWLSSANEYGRNNGSAPHLPNGELPLTFVYPQLLGAEAREREIDFNEGTGAKPSIGAIGTGHQTIGAAGGQWLSSPEQLQQALTIWRADVCNLNLDGEDLHKPQVLNRWVKLYHQLLEWGYKPRFMYSGQDIDELEDLTDLQEISLEELELRAGIELLINPPAQTTLSIARKLYHQAQTFTPNSTQHHRYLKWEVVEIIKNSLIAIKSALGTGKTEFLKALAVWAKEQGFELVFIGYRNNLLRQTCERIPDLIHVGDEDKIMLDSDYHKALCHHSAGLLDPARMENVILILDECVADLRDMLTSKLTSGRNPDGTDSRQVRLAHIKKLMTYSHSIVILDAYLTDNEVDFIRELRQFDFVHKVENTYKNNMDVRMVNKKSTATREVLDLALSNQGALLVTATTQKHCENLEKSLVKIGIPIEDIHRFDGKTDRNERSMAFFDNPGNYINKYKPRVVILSPTCETGVSIDLTGYFIAQYHFHLGNLGIHSGSQFLARYRDFSAPRIIYCEEQGQIDEGNSSCFSKHVKDEFDKRVEADLDLLSYLLDEGKIDDAKDLVNACKQQEDAWLKLAHKYKAIHNEEMRHLKELFIKRMREDGYRVTLDSDEDLGCADTEELFKKVEMERQVIRSTNLYNAPNIDKRAYETIKNNLTASESDRIMAAKYHLTQILLPGIMETESWSPELVQIVKFRHRNLPKQLENYHYLLNLELAEINHTAAWLPVAQTGSAWFPDQLNRSQLALIKAGRELGIHELIGREIFDDKLKEIAKKVSESKLLQSALKINIHPHSPPDPFKLCRRILKKFGIDLKKHTSDTFAVIPAKDKISSSKGAAKYELLTPELIERVKALSGHQYTSDNPAIQELGKQMEEAGMYDGRGRMTLVAGSARFLGFSVISRRYRVERDGEKVTTRKYTFSGIQMPISDAIKDTHITPGTTPVNLQHIYDCVAKRLDESAIRQQERIQEWKDSQTIKRIGLEAPIHIDDFASISKINLPDGICGSPEFTLENLRDVASCLLHIGQLEEVEMNTEFERCMSSSDMQVLQIAAQMVESKYPQVFERLKPLIFRN